MGKTFAVYYFLNQSKHNSENSTLELFCKWLKNTRISEVLLTGRLSYESTFVSKIEVLGFRRNMREPFFHCLPNMLFEFCAIAIENFNGILALQSN